MKMTKTRRMKNKREERPQGLKSSPKQLRVQMLVQQFLQSRQMLRPRHHLRAEKRGLYLPKKNLKHLF